MRWCATAALMLVAATHAIAQEPLRVLQQLPHDVARPSDVITITFDRPVAGTLEHTFDPSQYVRIEPAIRARVEWRDRSTIRIVPLDALEPARRYVVTVDTGFDALDGSRLATPDRFTIAVRGPALLGSIPHFDISYPPDLDPAGHVQLAFSAPVADSVLNRTVQLSIHADSKCGAARTIGYRVIRQRPVRESDLYAFYLYRWSRDSTSTRFRRVVELAPTEPLPEGCTADITLPSLDSLDATTVRYPLRTASPFGLEQIGCQGGCSAGTSMSLRFSAPVAPAELARAVHFEPAATFAPRPPRSPAAFWSVDARLAPRTRYRVTVDSSMRDIYGRPMTFGFVRIVDSGDRETDFGYHTGLLLLGSDRAPSIRIRHLNVDSVTLLLMPVPEGARIRLMPEDTRWSVAARGLLRDTVVRVVALHAAWNEERVTAIPLKELGSRFRGRLVVLQMKLRTAAAAPDAPPPAAKAKAKPITVLARSPRDPTARAVLEATDLLAHARLNRDGGSVLVTSAHTGRPLASARVALLDSAGAELTAAVTDRRGIAVLHAPHPRATPAEALTVDAFYGDRSTLPSGAHYVEVRLGVDRSLTSVLLPPYQYQLRVPQPDAVLDGTSLARSRSTRAFVFTDRGIYRPGDPVDVGATIREGILGRLTAPPAGDSARVRVLRTAMDGTTESIRDTVVRVSPFGTVTDRFRLRPQVETGTYRVDVLLARDDGWAPSGETSLLVAEYRAPEFLVDARVDSAIRIRGDSIIAHVSANYLFGAPMARMAMRWSADFEPLNPWELRIPGIGREWTVGEQGGWWSHRPPPPLSHLGGVDTLSDAGTARLGVSTDSAWASHGADATVAVSVTDLNRQVVSAVVRVVVHPASFYLAIRDSGSSMWWPMRAAHRVQLVAVRPDGRMVAGVKTRLAIVSYRWSPAHDGAEVDDGSPWHADTLRVDTVATLERPVTVGLPLIDEGPIEIVATAVDERGGETRTTVSRYVFGGAPIAGHPSLSLPVRLDSDHLKPGGTAVVTFTSPWDSADAWVTLEREGILSERLLRGVHGPVTVRLPVTEREVPNAFVSVILLRRGALRAADSTAERMRIGYASFRVDAAAKRLTVAVRPTRTDCAPGDSATFELTVRDARGRGTVSEATIWAVDEGVLALTGYATPDPMGGLYEPGRDQLRIASTLLALPSGVPPWLWRAAQWSGSVSRASMLSSTVSTGAGNSAFSVTTGSGVFAPLRSDFRTTAFFRGGVRTDERGVARVTVRLPDNVTTFRVMAVVAGAGDRYGSGESSLLVTKPVVVRAALPRFVRAGDSLLAGAVINARDRRPRSLVVEASGRGVALIGDAMTRTALDSSGAEVRFTWRGLDADSARFRMAASDGEHSDGVEITLPVKPDRVPRSHTVTGMAGDSAVVRFRLSNDLDPAKSRLTIRTGSSPIPTLRVAHDFLLASRYSCYDQLTSAGRMLVSLLAAERSGVKVLDDTVQSRVELQHIVDDIARRARERVHYDCWRPFWFESPVRAQANLLLLDARDIGLQVDSGLVRRLTGAYARLLDSLPLLPDTTYGRRDERRLLRAGYLQGRLGAVAFLQRTGAHRESDLRTLRDNAAQLTWEDRVWLAELLDRSGDHDGARTLLDRLWSAIGDAGNRVEVPDSVLESVGFPSHIRPVARLLEATLSIEPDHPRLGALVQRLITRTRAGHDEWWNTQDHVAATEALARFVQLHRGDRGQLTVRIGNDPTVQAPAAVTLATASGAARDTSVSLLGVTRASGDSTELTVRLHATGGAQFYALTVDEVTRKRPVTPYTAGLSVERWYERFDDGRTVTSVREGDLVRVRLRITATASRDFVTVEDVLPAGLETVDLSLRTSGTLGPFSSAASEASSRARDAEAGATSDDELYGSWYGGWWSPWTQSEQHDERTVFYAHKLWKGTFTLSYVARATTAGRFVLPPAHAEEMYNPAVSGRSDGGWFVVNASDGARKP